MITDRSPDVEPDWHAHDGEARLLVELLRTSRLAVLYCEPGTDKTAFLKSALMPLLGRRMGDRFKPAAARESGVVVPFPDRRKRASGHSSARKREFVVHFDDWQDQPLPALLSRIHQVANTCEAERSAPWQRLGDTLEALSSRLDASFIILFDRFEEFLVPRPDQESQAQFIAAWVEALHRSTLPVSFLVALDEDARSRLGSLRSRIPDLDDFSLKLARPVSPPAPRAPQPAESVAPATVPAPTVPTPESTRPQPMEGATPSPKSRRPKVKRPAQPRSEVKTLDVYALIESTLSRTVTEVSDDPFLAGGTADAVAPPVPAAPPAAPPPSSHVLHGAAAKPGRWRTLWLRIARAMGGKQ